MKRIFSNIKGFCVQNKEFLLKAFPYIFIAYFLLNFAIFYLQGLSFLKTLVYSNIFIYSTKLLSYLLIVFYGLAFSLANDFPFFKKDNIPFAIMIICAIISIIIVPKTISFYSRNQFNYLVEINQYIGFYDLMIGFIAFVIDIFVMFLFVSIFKGHIGENLLNPFLFFIVFFTFFECLYACVFQYNDIISIFKKSIGEDINGFAGYSTNLSGTFLSKNGFGFLLFQGVCANYYLLFHKKKNKHLKCLLIGINVLTHLITIFSLCKTAMVAIIVLDIGLFFSFLFNSKKRKLVVILIAVFFSIILLITVLLFTPLREQNAVLTSIYNKIYSLFFVSGEATTKSRIIIWSYAFKLLTGPYILFGYGRNVAPIMLNISANFISSTFHNVVLDILCSYGSICFIIYIYYLFAFIRASTSLQNTKFLKVFVFLVAIASLLYGMFENAVLLMSSSCVLLTQNLILCATEKQNKIESARQYEITI